MADGKVKAEVRKVDSLVPYANNAKRHTAGQITNIAALIKEVGFRDPIGVKPDGEIVEGHGRLMAAKELGMTEVPVLVITGLTEEQYRKYRIVHNKLSMMTGMEIGKLAEVVVGLVSSDSFNPAMLGITDDYYIHLQQEMGIGDGLRATKARQMLRPVGGEYEIIFSDEAQRKTWVQFNRRLELRGGKANSTTERLVSFIQDCGILGKAQ